jgi:hypothetical protein
METPMSHFRTGWLALVAGALAVPASAQEVEPVRIALHPAAAAAPALRYHLLPQLHEMAPGNAAERYKQAIAEMKKDRPAGPDDSALEDVQDWLELPPAELPRARARKLMERYAEVYRLADRAARSELCDWGIAERLRKMGIGALLPEIQDMRQLARLLALRARVEALDGHTERAVAALQTGFAAAKHVGESDTLIGTLVGVATGTLTARELELLLAQPKAPSLYWPLTDLPRPFLDMRKALQGERTGIYGTFPGLIEVVNNPDAPPMTPEQLKPVVNLLVMEFNLGKDYPTRAALSLWVRAKHKAAKEALVAAGYAPARVENMPHMQVALIHAMQQYDHLFDEMLKWQTFPYAEAKRGLEQADHLAREARAHALFPSSDTPALPLAPLFLPAIRRVWVAHARIDRRIAALRCVEAIRLYAAAHGGKLPGKLEDIKEVPVPPDPFTGKPFAYRLAGGVATLEGPPPAGETANAGNALTYELVLTK